MAALQRVRDDASSCTRVIPLRSLHRHEVNAPRGIRFLRNPYLSGHP
ncbi:hypothetical protein ACVW1C_008016 [Bradyrhizobium sp. USDA 4011]